ncbi:hypothetical protein [Streptomyces sp. DH12]|uniref:hypothetical protein n=1 Tax=Streptomyces sp. DH12 TaxID=2857010 RepID=UPI001E525AEF|nr:hypothetical protein [Streptomyces sp. DH12]
MSRERDQVLRRAVLADPTKEWTTKDVQELWRATGVDAPLRATARKALRSEPLLVLDDSNPTKRVHRARTSSSTEERRHG